MKRILTIALLLCMVCLLAGCCLSHEWQDATCETPKRCAKCEETEGEALGHSWQDATCETAKTCSACGETEGEALGHQLTWLPVLNDFEKMCGTCSRCDTSEEADIDWSVASTALIPGQWKGTTRRWDDGTEETIGGDTHMDMDIRSDGTATLTVDGEVFNFTWNYSQTTYPYGIAAAIINWYDFTLPDGGQYDVAMIGIQGGEMDEIILLMDGAKICFGK